MASTLIFIVFVILVLAGIFVWLYRNNSKAKATGERRSDLVTVRSYNGRPEAEVGKGFLAENGIRATVIADDAGGLRPDLLMAMGGARLVVRKQDADRAIEVLEPLP